MRYLYFISYLFFCICGKCVAQKPELYFEKITTQNGLSNNQVNCMLQDQRGFMWIGTNDGLNRYDGNHFVVFRNRPGDSTSISGNMITAIVEDKDAALWIATSDGGISRYDFRQAANRQFKQYKNIPGDSSAIPSNAINAMLDDAKGNLWLASTGFAVIRFNKTTGKFDRPVKGGPRTALALQTDGQGIIWVGRQGGGLLKINPATLLTETDKRYQDFYADLPHVTVTSIFRDKENNMWYGSWDKFLYQYQAAAKTETAYRQSVSNFSFIQDEIQAIAEDNQGNMWLGGKLNGLQLYNKASANFYQYRHNAAQEGSLADNTIRCIYIDRNGKIWIGTTKGISINNPLQRQFVQTFLPAANSDITIYDFYKDANGDLWIGTSAGIYLQKNNSNSFIHRPLYFKGAPLAVTRFFKSSNGNFYIGTSYSLFLYNTSNNIIQLLPNTEKDEVMNGIIASRVVAIAEDTINKHPSLLVSPYGHYLAYYDFTEKRWVSRQDSVKNILQSFNIKDNLVRNIYKAGNGSMWLANTQQGLGDWQKTPAPFINYYVNSPQQKEGLSNNNVYDITEDKNQQLWISTYGGGLHSMDMATKRITHYPVTNNLLEGIAADDNNHIWMVSNGNVYRYDPIKKTAAFFALPDLHKSGGVSGNMYKDSEGYLYVAGKGYYIRFQPGEIKDYRQQPTVYLTDFTIFNESYNQLLQQKEIRLDYRQNFFTIGFAAPDYAAAGPVQYAYMLEGWDKGWVNNGSRNYATFSNLEGGTYTFRVKAGTNTGNWNIQEQTIKIVIVPPFWKTWWFYALCAAFIAGVIYIVYRYRINELVKRQAIRNKIAQDLHDSVGSALSSISVYSQVAKIYKQKKQEDELQGTLEKISDTSGEMISEMNDIVWAINPRNDSMEKILQRMESFAKPLLQTKNIHFSFKQPNTLLSLNLPMEKRKNFYLIFKEAISNALRYSGCKNLEVDIQQQHHQIRLMVKDDGKGFDTVEMKALAAKSLSGNGLTNMKRRAAEMKGKCWIESTPGQGTTVWLEFPIT